MSFSSKVVIVTGASSGIGAATAILFSKEGAYVVMVGRNEAKLANVSEICEKLGNKPLVINADVSFEEDVRRIIKETVDTFGKIDVLVNNAGIVRLGCLGDEKILEVYDENMRTNLRAVVHLSSLATPFLKETKGNIVSVSSVGGQTTLPVPQLLAYSTSKAGLDHFSRCAALQLAPYGIRVNVVSPGPVLTDIGENCGFTLSVEADATKTALKRISESPEIADVIAFLASDKAKGITGSNFVADNGMVLIHGCGV